MKQTYEVENIQFFKNNTFVKLIFSAGGNPGGNFFTGDITIFYNPNDPKDILPKLEDKFEVVITPKPDK